MAISSWELVTISGEYITADLLIWRRFKMDAPGMVEAMLDANPHLALLHKQSPFLPVGTQVRIPIDSDILRNWPGVSKPISLW